MRRKPAWLLLALCAASAGCDLLANFSRNLVNEPALHISNFSSRLRNRKLANAAWDEVNKAAPRKTYSADYARGFKDGFADYLDGGAGMPPLPPRCYWRTRYRTPEGHQAIEDWFAGFHHGVAVAQESGYRELAIVPSALPIADASLPHAPVGAVPPGPPVEPELPAPRLQPTSESPGAAVEPDAGQSAVGPPAWP